MAKAPLKFLAVKSTRGHGRLDVQFSRDGSMWAGAVDRLDLADVQKQFARLRAHGASIVDTEEYKHV
jgi:hypothetical protein